MSKPYEETIDLYRQFARLEWLLDRYHQHNRNMHGPMGDPHRGQGRIVALLKMQPEISQKELSYLLDMRPQSMSELLSKLESGGFITRTPSESDRRVMNIRLTEEGVKATEQIEQDELFDCLSASEQLTLHEMLQRVIDQLETQLSEGNASGESDWRDKDRSFTHKTDHTEHGHDHHGMYSKKHGRHHEDSDAEHHPRSVSREESRRDGVHTRMRKHGDSSAARDERPADENHRKIEST